MMRQNLVSKRYFYNEYFHGVLGKFLFLDNRELLLLLLKNLILYNRLFDEEIIQFPLICSTYEHMTII